MTSSTNIAVQLSDELRIHEVGRGDPRLCCQDCESVTRGARMPQIPKTPPRRDPFSPTSPSHHRWFRWRECLSVTCIYAHLPPHCSIRERMDIVTRCCHVLNRESLQIWVINILIILSTMLLFIQKIEKKSRRVGIQYSKYL